MNGVYLPGLSIVIISGRFTVSSRLVHRDFTLMSRLFYGYFTVIRLDVPHHRRAEVYDRAKLIDLISPEHTGDDL